MSDTPMSPETLIEAAEKLAPLLRSKAREAELARRPLDEVIDAVRESGLFSMMVPACYGGHEADIDTFFEVSLTLSRADASMGWLIGFYIEHGFWFCGYPESFQKRLYADNDFILSPASLNVAGGTATRVEGGYRLEGRWQWGTGIIHADWVMAGAMVQAEGDAMPLPQFFALPVSDVEPVDTWHVSGMCGTGSWDFKVDDVFVPEEQVASMIELTNATGEASRLHRGALYQTPLIPILGFAAGLPMLGAAQLALEEWQSQTKAKIAANPPIPGVPDRNEGKASVVARAALQIEAAELIFRDVLADVMAHRNQATMEMRATWMTRQSHAVFMCREAVQDIASVTGASGARLESPIQRAVRDIAAGSNHAIFDRESRYIDYGKQLLGQPVLSMLS